MLEALAPAGGVIAMITGIDGAFYRPLGALMAFPTSADPVGSLSSGCIEGDLALHAQQVAETDTPRTLLYGKGSSFVDIRLPCGSGIEVTLLPIRDPAPLRATLERIDDRHETTLALPGLPDLRLRPDPRMVVFFHDHERELDILTAALDSDAFWIGAQGSRTAHARRYEGLQDRGVAKPAIDRVRGPIGLIPGTRDPRVLSISVLAEIIEAAR
jgi:xanthine dehydrogenase accessory factor